MHCGHARSRKRTTPPCDALNTCFRREGAWCRHLQYRRTKTSFAKGIVMNKLFAALALTTLIASPAFAQSYDPSVGSGNVAQQPAADSARDALAQQGLHLRNDLSGRTVLPYTRQEKEVIDRAKGDIW
jgi:hypothetical protein